MDNLKLNDTICFYRKKQGLTQEELAVKLGVTNQSVSKWESAQCCPDISLIAKLADIFEISIDELFGKEPKQIKNEVENSSEKDNIFDEAVKMIKRYNSVSATLLQRELNIGYAKAARLIDLMESKGIAGPFKSGKSRDILINDVSSIFEFPWPDDETLRIIVTKGRKILEKTTNKELKFKLDGDALNVVSYMNIECNNIMNGAEAKGNINCKGDISGGANSNGEIGCGKSISGGVQCGGNVGCGLNIDGAISCGGNVGCGISIKGDINCGGDIQCRKINGNVECQGNIIYK